MTQRRVAFFASMALVACDPAEPAKASASPPVSIVGVASATPSATSSAIKPAPSASASASASAAASAAAPFAKEPSSPCVKLLQDDSTDYQTLESGPPMTLEGKLARGTANDGTKYFRLMLTTPICSEIGEPWANDAELIAPDKVVDLAGAVGKKIVVIGVARTNIQIDSHTAVTMRVRKLTK